MQAEPGQCTSNKACLDRHFRQSKLILVSSSKTTSFWLFYVDDLIAFCPDDKPIDDFIQSMQKEEPQSYILEDQGDLKDYLGIEIIREDGMIHITQKHLIQKIIDLVNFKDERVNPVDTPASGILFKHSSDPDIDPKDAPFNYRSVIGSMNYWHKLQGQTSPWQFISVQGSVQIQRRSITPQ